MVTLQIHQKEEDVDKTFPLSTKLEKLVVDQQLPEEQRVVLPVNCDPEETEICTTPTAKEYRIPDVLTCPPAPRKRKAHLPVSDITLSNNKKSRNFYKFAVSSEIEATLGLHQVSLNNKIPWRSQKKFL